ncbi:ricin-type beta-trefoil lectin domain protein [Streptomyces bungoensis]|uniref:ricin-type beta-trefoil lectin domain protein n=1 Tax=Streptomyces bungoensis TaxID=285568 RepID=UPI003416189A
MRKAATSFVLAAVTTGTMAAVAAPAGAAPQARDPYAHTRLERVWAPNVCLSMGGSTKNNARAVVGKCSRTDKTQRWTLKRLNRGGSVFTVKNDKSGKCLALDSAAHVVQATCKPSSKSHQWWLASSHVVNVAKNKALASNSSHAGSKPYLEKIDWNGGPGRVRQEWGLS